MQVDGWGPFLPALPWQAMIIYQLAVFNAGDAMER